MQISLVFVSAVLMVHFLLPLHAYASPPLPKEKPIQELGERGFIEGIDVPEAKPAKDAKSSPTAPVEGGRKSSTTETPELASCDIQGAVFDRLAPLHGDEGNEGCGIAVPVNLTGVSSESVEVAFPTNATLSCGFVKTLTEWVIQDVVPLAQAEFGKPVSEFFTGPGYQCRRRNNQPDGKLSEHALGKAIDITAFRLSDGTEISVETDWASKTKKGNFLASVHKAACKRFTTVLGPDADPNHKSHFHLDIGCHGKSCTYVICQ
ncbi:extensin family protein [Roseibium sp. FZY0029]|uniref:extensin-like domain-containing protein n=1 Tax=Roseibium sp. FZY0029 TaxID=3116647 RepID=UPI002EC0B3A4|nr:extensin family protein [Roseibium sp. FZY0029]